MGHTRVLPLSTAIANMGQSVPVSRQRRHSDPVFWILIVLCDCTSRSASQVSDRHSQSSQSTSNNTPQIRRTTTRCTAIVGADRRRDWQGLMSLSRPVASSQMNASSSAGCHDQCQKPLQGEQSSSLHRYLPLPGLVVQSGTLDYF